MKNLAGNKYIIEENNIIILDQVPIDKLLNQCSTPIMIFLENKLRENIISFKNVFNSVFPNFECFYSFKANYLLDICKVVNSENIGAEVVGLPELQLALKIGFSPDKIIVGGPYLPLELIQKSIDNEIKEIIVYNLNSLEKINDYAKKKKIVQNICIRVNSSKFNSKLGIVFDKNNLRQLEVIMKSCENIKIKTVLSHFSTQMNNLEQFIMNLDNLIQNINKLKKISIDIENINLGGGFPEATVMNQDQLKKIAYKMKELIDDANLSNKKVYFEPGRYFIGDAGIFLAEIIQSNDSRWAFLNIGNHICPKFAKCALRFYNASQINQPHKYKTSFAGIVPTDQDVLAKNYYFTEKMKEGDVVLITNVGAYCLTFSNSFPYPLPNIFLIKRDEIKKIYDNNLRQDFSLK